MAADFLDKLFEYCDLSPEHKDFIFQTLFKYKQDPIINALCEMVAAFAVEHKRFIDVVKEADNNAIFVEAEAFPLTVLCQNDPTALRVYPSVMLNTHSNLEGLSPLYCTEALKNFLVEYEKDLADDKRKQKWETLERAQASFTQYVDMPTARALTRYIFPEGKHKDNVIRDLADTIDAVRKPLELSFADTPEEFTIMYGSGPHSCMAFSAEGKEQWKFFNKHGLCPASWYAYYPNTRGCYALKNKKVVARAMLFKDQMPGAEPIWKYGRVYSTTPEFNSKFIASMIDMGIKQLASGSHTPVPGTTFEIPGALIDGKTYGCPWPYFDNLPREPKDWGCKFDDKTHIFTIQFKPTRFQPIYNRTGHLRSTDYVTIECSNCGNHVDKKTTLLEVEGGVDTFCSDNCAADMGYLKVWDGAGVFSYKRPSEDLIDILGEPMIKFSTLKAAYDQGYNPAIEEQDIFPEETDYSVTRAGVTRVSDSRGINYMLLNVAGVRELPAASFTPNKVPFNMRKPMKSILFNTEAELVVEI